VWHLRKEQAAEWREHARQHRHQARFLGHAHDAEPEGHDADQAERDFDCRFGGVDRGLCHLRGGAVEHRHDQGDGQEGEPDVVQHAAMLL
jgi:hypothetical protein